MVKTASSAQQQPATVPSQQAPLMPFDATGRTAWAVPFGWQEYAVLVDWTGRKNKGPPTLFLPDVALAGMNVLWVGGSQLIIFGAGILIPIWA